MAKFTPQSFLAFLCILNILVSTSFSVARNIADMKHPDSFISLDDPSVLIPGVGRVMVPDHMVNPYTYNPVTGKSGTDSGTGISTPGIVGGSTGRSYVPGGDDTPIPNPGVEVPITGSVPAPSALRP